MLRPSGVEGAVVGTQGAAIGGQGVEGHFFAGQGEAGEDGGKSGGAVPGNDGEEEEADIAAVEKGEGGQDVLAQGDEIGQPAVQQPRQQAQGSKDKNQLRAAIEEAVDLALLVGGQPAGGEGGFE